MLFINNHICPIEHLNDWICPNSVLLIVVTGQSIYVTPQMTVKIADAECLSPLWFQQVYQVFQPVSPRTPRLFIGAFDRSWTRISRWRVLSRRCTFEFMLLNTWGEAPRRRTSLGVSLLKHPRVPSFLFFYLVIFCLLRYCPQQQVRFVRFVRFLPADYTRLLPFRTAQEFWSLYCERLL